MSTYICMEAASPCIVVVQGDSGRGRVTVATRSLAPGEIVLAEHAVACVAAAGRSLCDDCLKSITCNDRGKRGSCGQQMGGRRGNHQQCVNCQSRSGRSSGSGHTPRGSSSYAQAPSSAVRLAVKLILLRRSGSLDNELASRIDSLMHQHDEQQRFATSTEDCSSSSRHKQDEEDCTQVARLVSMGGVAAGATTPLVLSGDHGDKAAPDTLIELARTELSRVSLNAITTCDGSGATGLGLFLSAAMFNHGCRPNCQAWWKGSKLEIRCTKPVAAGEELCFSYIPIDQPSTLRRAQLRHNWFFTCHCTRCVSGQWDAELTGLKCPGVPCTGAVRDHVVDGGGSSCNQCSFRAVDGRSADQAGKGPPRDTTTAVSPGGDDKRTKRLYPVGSSREEHATTNRRCEESLRGARNDFEDGMQAYMREDPEVALVALEKSLLVRERILHPFNKDLLRTLRYSSYAAVATRSWVKAQSFLNRWLHPMETMFGAAEVWDIAAMRIDAGLVLDKLHGSKIVPETVPVSPLTQSGAANRYRMHPAAYYELTEGLKWIWVCLGKDSGLPAETTALEVFSDRGINFKLGNDTV